MDMNVSMGTGTPEVDVHICVVMDGEPLYIPDGINQALGLSNGGSYMLVRVNDMVVIAPRRVAVNDACAQLDEVTLPDNNTLSDMLERVEAARAQLMVSCN